MKKIGIFLVVVVSILVFFSDLVFDKEQTKLCRLYADHVVPDLVNMRSDGYHVFDAIMEIVILHRGLSGADLGIITGHVFEPPYYSLTVEKSVFYGKCVAGLL